MYKEPIFLKPAFQEKIWGGDKLKTEFDYDIPSNQTGEAWVISAHSNGPSTIENGPLTGQTLTNAWDEHGELFNKASESAEEYPLLVKILDANADLSVQVHPDDAFARKVEDVPYGKTECWYVLGAEKGANIVLGHHAKTQEELESMMDHEEWDRLLQHKTVTPGDFFYVPSGTIHAIGKGIVILEIQQSSDITYRVYDYDRTDAEGNKRQLHLERSKQVTTVPHQPTSVNRNKNQGQDLVSETLVEAPYFSVYHWKLDGKVSRKLCEDFLQVSVIKGDATLQVNNQSFNIGKGDNFILPHTIDEYQLSGQAELVVSHT